MVCETCGHNSPADVTCYVWNTPDIRGGVFVIKHWYCRKCQTAIVRRYKDGVDVEEVYPDNLDYDS